MVHDSGLESVSYFSQISVNICVNEIITSILISIAGERGPCYRYHCSYGAICVVRGGFPTCECPTCAEEFEPVCGTDGISYTNHCKLKREACEQKSEIAVAYAGLCSKYRIFNLSSKQYLPWNALKFLFRLLSKAVNWYAWLCLQTFLSRWDSILLK